MGMLPDLAAAPEAAGLWDMGREEMFQAGFRS